MKQTLFAIRQGKPPAALSADSWRARRKVLCGSALLMLLSLCPGMLHAQQSSLVTWATSSLDRIWRNSTAGSSKQIDLYAAKDETYSFQIGLQTPSGSVTNVTAATTGLVGPSGTIAGSDVVFYREEYVYAPALPSWLSGGSNPPGGAGMYPDGLIPFVDDETGLPASGGSISAEPFTVTAGKNQVLWIDVHVPPSYEGGTYTGTIAISSDQGASSIQVNLHVWNFALPKIPSYKTSLQATSAADRNDRMARELLRNRQSPSWSISSRALESQYIDEYGLDSVDIFMGTGWYNSNCQGTNPTSPTPMPSISQFSSAYAAHDPRLVIHTFLADEVYPDAPQYCQGTYPTLVQWARAMHTANPSLKTFLSISPEGPVTAPLYADGTGQSAVNIWGILPMMYQQHTAEIQARQAAGDSMWLYNVLVQDDYSPKQNINWGSLDWRLSLGFLSANLGFTGFQQWSIDTWSSDPWNTVVGAKGANPNVPADGMSMYPGSAVGITGYAPSMRIKWSRDGINDYEYVQILKKLGQFSWAKSQIDPIAHDFAHWTRDYTQVEAVRIALGNKIDQLSGGGTSAPVASATPQVGLTCSPLSVSTPGTSACSVSLTSPAQSNFSVSLQTNNTAVSIPASVTVPAGSSSAAFKAAAQAVQTNQSVALSATGASNSPSVTLSLLPTASPAALSGISCTPTSISTPGTASCSVTLSGAAPTGGATITLTSDNSSVSAPATISVPAGSLSGGFTVTAASIGSGQTATLTALAGSSTVKATLSLLAAASGPAINTNGYYRLVNRNSGNVLDVSGASSSYGASVIQWPWWGGDNQKWQLVPVSGGYYELVNKNSGQVLDINGASTVNGTRAIQWPWWGGDNQKWQLKPASDGYYELVNKNSGQLLDVSGGSTANGATVIQWPSWNGPNQQWMLAPVN